MRKRKDVTVGRSHHRHGVARRNPHARSLGKAQYRKRIVPSKKRDIKPEIGNEYD